MRASRESRRRIPYMAREHCGSECASQDQERMVTDNMEHGSCQGKSHWPPALRRRLGIPKAECVADVKDVNDQADSGSGDDPLSAHQLRGYIHDGYAKMTSIQRQLHRGEEHYFEDSHAHRESGSRTLIFSRYQYNSSSYHLSICLDQEGIYSPAGRTFG